VCGSDAWARWCGVVERYWVGQWLLGCRSGQHSLPGVVLVILAAQLAAGKGFEVLEVRRGRLLCLLLSCRCLGLIISKSLVDLMCISCSDDLEYSRHHSTAEPASAIQHSGHYGLDVAAP
jgi:hypothetical protein